MLSRKKGIEKFSLVLILLFAYLSLIPTLLLGEKAFGEAEGKSERKAGFELTVEDDLISLSAEEATLSEIIEEIGREMSVEVAGNIPEEEKISVEFEKLLIKEALEKLNSNYGYQMDSEKGENKIAKIIILPKGEKLRALERETTISVKHEPFKFEFDPAEFTK